MASRARGLRSARPEPSHVNGRGELLLLAIALLVVVALALARPQQTTPLSTYSSYDTGPNGYRALYEVMRREGARERRFEEELGRMHDVSGTLVISSSDPERFASRPSGVVDAADGARLAAFVRAGGRLVVLGDALAFAGARAPMLPPTHEIGAATTALPGTSEPLSDGVRRVTSNFTTAFTLRGHGVHTLLAVRGHPVAIAYAAGRGEVIAMTSPGLFGNAVLARAQNARFAYDVLSGHGTVFFDERVHGYTAGPSMWMVLPQSVRDAVWIAAAIVLLAVFGGLFRSAPPMALEPPRPRETSAYIASMAALLRRTHAGSAAIDRFAHDAALLARARPSLAGSGKVAAQLARLNELRDLPHPSDAALLDAARLNLQLRKELV